MSVVDATRYTAAALLLLCTTLYTTLAKNVLSPMITISCFFHCKSQYKAIKSEEYTSGPYNMAQGLPISDL